MIELHQGYCPGGIGRVVELHGSYYHEHWGFGPVFEAKVARELAEFINRYDAGRDAIWFAMLDGEIHGSVTLDGVHARDEGAHLRWFIMSDRLRGQGVGARLLGSAVDFCKARDYRSLYLWTFAGLQAARKLYDDIGFEVVHEDTGAQWGTQVTEQKMTLILSPLHEPASLHDGGS